jgi:hypothetical protein
MDESNLYGLTRLGTGLVTNILNAQKRREGAIPALKQSPEILRYLTGSYKDVASGE